jgi:hypothetical protein
VPVAQELRPIHPLAFALQMQADELFSFFIEDEERNICINFKYH